MSNFGNIFEDTFRVVTFQPREARMHYRLPEREEGIQTPERKSAFKRLGDIVAALLPSSPHNKGS